MKLCDWCPAGGGNVATIPTAKNVMLTGCINCVTEDGIIEYYLCDFHMDYYRMHQQTTCYHCHVRMEFLVGKL